MKKYKFKIFVIKIYRINVDISEIRAFFFFFIFINRKINENALKYKERLHKMMVL